MAKLHDPFKSRHKFQDDVWGQMMLNDLERDVIDTPEFQRLFRTSQMGFVNLVYQTANHTRGAHSIGACFVTNELIDRLTKNTTELYDEDDPTRRELYPKFTISPAERILIRLGALLHDVSHVPLSHDLERKTHKIPYEYPKGSIEMKVHSCYGHYDKHDDYDKNPLLYALICDTEHSVLARVLRRYSQPFYDQLQRDSSNEGHAHLADFVTEVRGTSDSEWKPGEALLPQLLFHLLIYEKPVEAEEAVRVILTKFGADTPEHWHLGPKSLTEDRVTKWHQTWYQPYRHDIIGNTLSADLIDYLTRDPQRLGTKRRIDLHLLSYYVLVNAAEDKTVLPKQYRCAMDLQDLKRGTSRTFLLNDLFRLLDLRQDIHEKAVMHRVVQSAIAMLSRALLLLKEHGKLPPLEAVVAFNAAHALQGEAVFFKSLLDVCDAFLNEIRGNAGDGVELQRMHVREARRIFEKLIERRVYRPLMVIPGDKAVELPLPKQFNGNPTSTEFQLRTLAGIIDSHYYSRFLLFVCSCVEKYLEGVFDKVGDLCTYARETIAEKNSPDDPLVRQAMSLKPSRALIWTTPYKQLYKDPAVVVALEGCVGQIDEIYKPRFNPEYSTRERIQKAIDDADSKYATLWQLYVFISDGLFYTGILNKLLNSVRAHGGNVPDRDTHEDRLKKSESLFTIAFKAVCSDWSTVSRVLKDSDRNAEVEKKGRFLNAEMESIFFRKLVARWIADYEQETLHGADPAHGLSTVDIKHYVHECALSFPVTHDAGRPCRDSRYKFDDTAELEWRRAEAAVGSAGHELIQFLKKCQVDDPKVLSRMEFDQLTELYSYPKVRARCESLLRSSVEDKSSAAEGLKALWLRGFPWPEPGPVSTADLEFPKSRRDIERWVRQEARILQPNVRRSLIRDIRPILDVLEWAVPRHRRAVFDDFRLRMENEAAIVWNDVRAGRIVNALRKRWNYPDAPASPTSGEGE